jgi:hypothetical protein
MEQRPLRLGDIVDDYCPRERRVTNHAIVAIVEDAIRQTRCTTCDTEHVFKGGQAPRKRVKDANAALYQQVLAEVSPAQLVSARGSDDAEVVPDAKEDGSDDRGATDDPADAPSSSDESSDQASSSTDGAWLAHRRLIRATLPRTEGEPSAPRPIPEFTMHQRPQSRSWHANRQARDGQFGGRGHQSFGQGRSGHHAGKNDRHRGKNKRSR